MSSSPGQSWAYTSFADAQSVYLVINGTKYALAQFTASFALNSLPTAVCMLAVGRLSRDGTTPAQANQSASGFKQMLPAQVYFNPQGSYKPDLTSWSDATQGKDTLVFDGYYTGGSYQKINGKVNFIVNLVHWLVDLSFSSCLSATTHAANSGTLNFSAVMQPMGMAAGSGQAGSQTVFLPQAIGHSVLASLLPSDVWNAFKTYLCFLASLPGFDPTCNRLGGDNLQLANTRALRALSRIEGPTLNTSGSLPYAYGLPLPLTVSAQEIYQGIAEAVNYYLISDLWHMTFWDLLVGRLLPTFGLVLCPAIDRALITADLPGYRVAKPWRKIIPDEYDFMDQTALVPRPLRGVIAHGASFFEAGANANATSIGGSSNCIGGGFLDESVTPEDGIIMYTQIPEWVAGITTSTTSARFMTGNGAATAASQSPGATPAQQAIRTAITTIATLGYDNTANAPITRAPDAQSMMNEYAHMVFLRETLRGRNGTVSGKLRLDIAPGSKIQLVAQPEIFLGSEDALAEDMFCEVNRVTLEINAESRRAATAMVVTYLRNTEENQDDRTSSAVHPIYQDAVVVGFPLLPAFENS